MPFLCLCVHGHPNDETRGSAVDRSAIILRRDRSHSTILAISQLQVDF